MNLTFDVGLGQTQKQEKVYDLVVIGSGPAGLSAALYGGRAHLDTLVLTGSAVGGQIATTYEVENYPGFPDGLTGPELMENIKKQAENFGAVIKVETVTAVDFSRRPFHLTGLSGAYQARAVIITTGASARKLDVPGEKEFTGRGVSYCATCDGWFFQDKDVIVVGGGDSAMEEALFLTKYARQVTVVHRRDALRAGATLQKRALANEKIAFMWDTVVTEILGEGNVQAVRVKNKRTGEEQEHPIDGVFVFIGHLPNTKLFAGQLEMDEQGYLVTDAYMATNVKGVWAAGEVSDPVFRQVITSAGMGAAAAIQAQRWLDEQEESEG